MVVSWLLCASSCIPTKIKAIANNVLIAVAANGTGIAEGGDFSTTG
jgi:hypothetical protein